MFDPAITEAAKRHALAEYPNEAAGVVTPAGYVALCNTSPRPTEEVVANMAALFARGRVQAIIHSHPDGPAEPSEADRYQRAATAVPWAIIVTDGRVAHDPIWF